MLDSFNQLYQLASFANIAYAYIMKNKARGFTIVEVTLVVTVIAILAAIGVLAVNGILISGRNKARETDTRTWASTFDLYKNRFVVYPAMPTADTPLGDVTLCLGSFTTTNNKCGQYNSGTSTQYVDATASASLLTETAKVGNVPQNSGVDTHFPLAGPLVYLSQTTTGGTVTVTGKFINFFEAGCPSGFTDISSSLPTSILGVLASTSFKACSLNKTFSYTPN